MQRYKVVHAVGTISLPAPTVPSTQVIMLASAQRGMTSSPSATLTSSLATLSSWNQSYINPYYLFFTPPIPFSLNASPCVCVCVRACVCMCVRTCSRLSYVASGGLMRTSYISLGAPIIQEPEGLGGSTPTNYTLLIAPNLGAGVRCAARSLSPRRVSSGGVVRAPSRPLHRLHPGHPQSPSPNKCLGI